MDIIEEGFDAVGMMRGTYAVEMRATVGAVAAGFLVTYLQPSSMFTKGVARPWSLISNGDGPVKPTSTPWFFIPAAAAFVCGVLI